MIETPPFDFDAGSTPVSERVAAGLSKIGLALKARAWRGAGPARLTPTQGQTIALLRSALNGMSLQEVARALGITAATASDSVSSLVSKGLVDRGRSPANHRAVVLTLTPAGMTVAEHVAEWPDFLFRAVGVLNEDEQAGFLRSLVKVIRALQDAGDIPVQRMCVTCRFFRPNIHADDVRPHHCALVDAPLGDRHLRLECVDQEPAGPELADVNWRRWTAQGGAAHAA